MTSRKTYKTLVESLENFFNLVDQSLLVFGEGVKNYLHRDLNALNGNIQAIVKLQGDSSLMAGEIEKLLVRNIVSPGIKGDILRLLEIMSRIIDTLYNVLFQFEIERPNIPDELNTDLLKLMEFTSRSVSNSIPAAKAFFNAPATVPDMVRRVHFYQKEADRQSKSLKRTVFHDLNYLKLSEKFHLRYFALHIEEVAELAMRVADQLSVMTLRSQNRETLIAGSSLLPIFLSSSAFVISLVCAVVFIFGSELKSVAPNLILVVVSAIICAFVAYLIILIIRTRRSKYITDKRLLAKEEEINDSNRKISEMEVQIMKMENDHLQNLLDLKRKETTGVVEKVSEQKDFIDNIYDIVQKAESATDPETRDALLHEAKVQLNLRRNHTDGMDDFYAQVEQIHKDFSVRLAARFPNLSAQERKLATLLRLEFSSKYIASVMNISPKSVEVGRHRLRNKMGLERSIILTEFIKTI